MFYFSGPTSKTPEPPPQPEQPTSTTSDKKKTDAEGRGFKNKWREEFDFVEYDTDAGLMYCTVCRKHSLQKTQSMVVGTTNFKTSTGLVRNNNKILSFN